jgi:hypothetical protein
MCPGGMQIPRTDDASDLRGAGSTLGFGKGKEKVATSRSAPKMGYRSPPRDVRASTEPTAPRRRRGDWFIVVRALS